MDLLAFILAVLQITEETDRDDMIFWRTQGDFAPVTFFVLCSDTFSWATADAEQLTDKDVPDLRQAVADAYAVEPVEREWGFILWVCRKRGQRPADFAMPHNPALRKLFEEADGTKK